MACVSKPPQCGHVGCLTKYKHSRKLKQLALLCSCQSWIHMTRYCLKTPKRDSELPGYLWMLELWNGNEDRFFQQFRMRKHVMHSLLELLQMRYGFHPFNRVAIDESLGIFLMILGYDLTYPIIEERFQHSGQTVNAHFYEMLAAICRLGIDYIKPSDPSFSEIPAKISDDPRFWPHFKGCIGAIDGTHINLRMNESECIPWINRKGVPSTNVLATCDFNHCITYAKIWLEGSMHDSRVLYLALRDVSYPFSKAPTGKYYLADSGYPNIPGFLVPCKRTRYHLLDFRQANNVIRTRPTNFNHAHSSLRSVIERTFGILKQRFKILNGMTGKFDVDTQIKIIWAAIALHNFLRRYDENDVDLLGPIDEDGERERNQQTSTMWQDPTEEDCFEMDMLCDSIRDGLRFRQVAN